MSPCLKMLPLLLSCGFARFIEAQVAYSYYPVQTRDSIAPAYYFCDETGREVPRLGRWQQAGDFDWLGFARVSKPADHPAGRDRRAEKTRYPQPGS